MTEHDILFPKISYPEHLTTIQNIYFTRREIDTIACLFNTRTAKRIASLLGIAPRTVQTHTRNVRNKLGCGSSAMISDFIEKSGAVPYLRRHYAHLLVNEAFEKCLRISVKLNMKTLQQILSLMLRIQTLTKLLGTIFPLI
ncbi:MAG: LuxR C-terminal-related transcriptional regulator [Alphaproteobacteria bacterium]|nr:LuxR C-terminal-related transcriptional regulator [Alphaproteobacteria bacterium]